MWRGYVDITGRNDEGIRVLTVGNVEVEVEIGYFSDNNEIVR